MAGLDTTPEKFHFAEGHGKAAFEKLMKLQICQMSEVSLPQIKKHKKMCHNLKVGIDVVMIQ